MAIKYLQGSIFDRNEWQTHVKTNRITTKERVLGHMIGPGLVYAFYSMILSLRELFYMDVLRMNTAAQTVRTERRLSAVSAEKLCSERGGQCGR